MGAETEPTTQPNVTDVPSTTVPPTTTTTPDVERDEKGRFRNPLQPRVDALTREKHESRREADYWKQRATSLEEAAKPKAAAPPKPESKDYATYDEYVEALTDWKAEQKSGQKVNEALTERDEREKTARVQETRATSWSKSEEQAKLTHPDYHEVVGSSDVPIASHVAEALLDSPRGAELSYHLATNPDVAKKLNGLSERQVAMELGRIEAKLPDPVSKTEETEPKDEGGKPEPKVTVPPDAKPQPKAPPAPTKSLKPGASTQKDLSKMSMDEYVTTRKAQGARWARR